MKYTYTMDVYVYDHEVDPFDLADEIEKSLNSSEGFPFDFIVGQTVIGNREM